jgi:hypothetical protein
VNFIVRILHDIGRFFNMSRSHYVQNIYFSVLLNFYNLNSRYFGNYASVLTSVLVIIKFSQDCQDNKKLSPEERLRGLVI